MNPSPVVSDDELRRIRRAWELAREALLAAQSADGCWIGELSSSALATATAISALSLAAPQEHAEMIARALSWLEATQNPDGGWGDTPTSPSNLPTTMLVRAAFALAGGVGAQVSPDLLKRSDEFVRRKVGTSPEKAVAALYGKDRTFVVPILANCALAGDVNWRDVPSLPFELACLPRAWLRWVGLPVVSYALPALIAIGQLIHVRKPPRGFIFRVIRRLAFAPTTRLLEAIQPESGGFLEAIPLTSFVVMSLVASGNDRSPVVARGLEFLRKSARPEGSWPIDVNLSCWLTSLAAQVLSAGEDVAFPNANAVKEWLIAHQHTKVHPYTGSPPGGWGWTHLSGGVPDVDDTSGALLALARLDPSRVSEAAARGIRWLLNLQNCDGGWPTFCRGWGKMPFDRSAPDLTAHALRAIAAWKKRLHFGGEDRALNRGIEYLRRAQRSDGAWIPLWFGNQLAPEAQNPTYGTARVLMAYHELGCADSTEARRGISFLLRAQNSDGSWGGDRDVPGSMEETALVVEALAPLGHELACAEACAKGCRFLAERVESGGLHIPAPIGLYFARLWYSERLYPIIWTVAGLGAALHAWGFSSEV